MSQQHGGYDAETLKKAGVEPRASDFARQVTGYDSAASVSTEAPESDRDSGDGGEVARGSRGAQKSPGRPRKAEKEARDAEAKAAIQRILRMRCKRAAVTPYIIWAKALGIEEIKLTPEEEQEVTDGYYSMCLAFGWEGVSKIFAVADALMCNVTPLAERLKYLIPVDPNLAPQPAERPN